MVSFRLMAMGVALASVVGIVAEEARAQQARIPCGDFYEVRGGDTLREIALAAYGVGSYQLIYNANQDIMRSPSLLLVGQELFIPCLDGSGPATREEAERLAAATSGTQIQPPAAAPQTQPAGTQGTQPTIAPQPVPDPAAAPASDTTAEAEPQAILPPLQQGDQATGAAGQRTGQAGGGTLAVEQPGNVSAEAQPVLPPQTGNIAGATTTGDAQQGSNDAVALLQPVQPPNVILETAPEPEPEEETSSGAQPVIPLQPGGDNAGEAQASLDIQSRLLPEGSTAPLQAAPAPVQPLPQRLPSGEEAAAREGTPQAVPPVPSQQADQQGEQTAAVQAVPPEEPSLGGDDGFDRTIRLLTGSNFAPFTDQDLPQGGMITEIVSAVLAQAAPDRKFRITFVNDWAAHLDVLLPDGAFDVGFPWYRPDCSQIAKLSDVMQQRCNQFNFSRPLYEVVVGYYARANDPLVGSVDHTDMFGRTLCRPRGYFTFDLETADLVEPNIAMETPETPGECFDMLQAGTVDVVTLNILLAENEITSKGIGGEVVELPDLATIQTLHLIAPRTSPYGRTYLTLMNQGIRQVRESGRWFEIVSRHLAQHAARTAAAE